MGLLRYVSYVATAAAFAFVTLSLASGLLYISELIEEHSRLAKSVGKRGLYVVILIYILLYFFDSLPLAQTAFSIVCHIVYLQNFSNSWPLISLTSPFFIASCILVLADHFTWFFYFAKVTHEARYLSTYRNPPPNTPGFTEIASFFAICVWLVPLFLFLSLSANDNTLPVSTAEPGTPPPGSTQATQNRVSLIRSIFSLFSFDMVPRVRSRSHASEGIIAPRSPKTPRAPASPMLGGSPRLPPLHSPMNAMTPPLSPGPFALLNREFESKLSKSYNFKLGTPPNRRPGTIVRRQTSDVIGAELRQTEY
ncbi:hypothetical protein APHAL10511_001720 [Amanita phalloides]|nr:hypothetical protein APHAL10511_001720 [Amanita phalloides]